jgi:hypothetical protein
MDKFLAELIKASDYFSEIENDEKEVDFNYVKRLISSIDSKRNELKSKYPKELLDKNFEKVKIIAKQISQSIDNVIKQREAEKKSVALELEKINNKKKIATYIR